MTIKSILPNQAATWLADGDAILIDVREAEEYKAEHIAYAISLPLSNIEALLAQLNIPQSRKIIFQCLKSARGEKACDIASKTSHKEHEIYNIEGGITAWKEATLPIVSTQKNIKMSIFRQVQTIVGSMVAIATAAGLYVHEAGFIVAGLLGTALAFAGITGWCGLAMLLNKMPWNK
tara:strand:+ start:13015 stop:13545 length:531 start_codon:yes stop_codon:yes gene_type:complete